MKKIQLLAALVFIGCIYGCKTTIPVADGKEDGKLTFKFVQVNDVYEIAPLSGGKYGGMARVAHIVDSVRAVNPNTYLFMAGDFLNPSLLGTVKVEGERLRGRHMIDVMNAMNFELATFGNHEFDLNEADLQKRMDESNFYWTSANVFQNTPEGPSSFHFRRNNDTLRVPETYSIAMEDTDGTKIDVGIFSVTIDSNPKDYVYYADAFLEAESAMSRLEMQQSDVIVGLTHLKVSQDVELSNKFPNITLIMGGHEHNAMLIPTNSGVVAKADANAKSVYIHTLTHDLKTKKTTLDSHLKIVDEKVSSSPTVKAVVDKWQLILNEKIKEVVAEPEEVIYVSNAPLDGTDSANRGLQTNLGEVITQAMTAAYENEVDGALVNGGSFRLDDMLSTQVTSLDVFRVLPFGGGVLKVELTGALLKEILDYGKKARGTGAYLQRNGFSVDAAGNWLLDEKAINDSEVYAIAMSDFLMKGYDIPFLTPENKDVVSVYQPKADETAFDIRKTVILFMKSNNEQ